MEKSKIAEMVKGYVPIEWNGRFDGKKVFEKVEYDDGTTLEIELSLSKKRQENPSETFAGTIPRVLIDIEIEDDYDEDEEEEEDLYVVCGDEKNPQLVHKDIMDLYLEVMDDNK